MQGTQVGPGSADSVTVNPATTVAPDRWETPSPVIPEGVAVTRSAFSRILTTLLACALVAAACSSGSDSAGSDGASDAPDTTLSSDPDAAADDTETSSDDAGDGEASDSDDSAGGSAEIAPTIEFESGVEQIAWTECPSGLECGSVTVPADYADPSLGSLEIVVNVARARVPEERRGFLLVNPGGPGASGTEIVDAAVLVFTDEVLDHFDIIGFDPRGVGESEPAFTCGEKGEALGLFATTDPPIDTLEEVAIVESAVDLCVESMGPAAGRLHSEFVARDMDEIRKALGAEQISYLGFSYGSALGVWYASLFPENVRAMVVDGADNPLDDVSTQELRIENFVDEISEFERLLTDALASCDSAECPIFNDGDPIGYYFDAADKFDLVVADVSDNPDAAFLGLIQPLYDEAAWPSLHEAIFALNENDDATPFSTLARSQLLEDEDGVNITGYINCLDGYSLFPELDRATQVADEEAIEAVFQEEFPLLAAANRPSVSLCPYLDAIAPAPFEGDFDGGDVPILVIGNPSDPATPFSESEELVEETLSNGYLLEADHASHVVYPSNDCANALIHALLIDVELPADQRSTCAREEIDDDDRRRDLRNLCLFVLPETGVEFDDAESAEVCDEFVSRAEAEVGLELVDALNAGDQDAAIELFAVLGPILAGQ